MATMLDAGTMLAPSGLVSSTQDFPAILAYPRTLPTCHWVVSMLTPPSASATFTLAVSSTQNGTYSVISTLVWPAGLSGSKQLPIGVSGRLAAVLNTTSVWIRASVTLSGPLTLAGSWLSKPSDGGPGLASRSYALDNITAF